MPKSNTVADQMYAAFLERVAVHDQWVVERNDHAQRSQYHREQADRSEDGRLVAYEELLKFQSVGEAMGIDLFAMLENHKEMQREPFVHDQKPEPLSVKEFVLSEVRRAFPNPMKAAEIRVKLEAAGQEVHEKTVGMTLYRLSKSGKVKREGIEWFFVPENPQAVQPAEDAA